MLDVKLSNAYADGRVVVYSDGTKALIRDKVQWKAQEGDWFYTVRERDFLRGIAAKEYKGMVEEPAEWWWLIADANDIENPLYLADLVGTEILIPNVRNFNLKR